MNLKTALFVCASILAPIALAQVPVQKTGLGRISIPDAVRTAALVGHADPNKVLKLTISLPYADPAGMQAFVDSVSNPDSPNFRQFITPQEVADRFAQSNTTLLNIVNYLKGQGFTVGDISASRLTISASCTVAQAEAAFNTKINNYRSSNPVDSDRPNFYSFTSTLQVPTSVAPYILDISGLQNYSRGRHHILTPTQARQLYGTAPQYGSGFKGQNRSVAISSWDGYRLTNVPLYYAKYGLPTPFGGVGTNITEIHIDGGSGAGNPSGEGDIDIQMVLGMAPLCKFYIYDGGAGDIGASALLDVLSREQSDNIADIISESYGWILSTTEAQTAHNIHLAMNAQGITYMAATGDSGTQIEPFSYSDYDPEVLLVGGTEATTDSLGNRISEITWSGDGAGGGGWSTNTATFNTRPSWQVGNGVPTSINKRLGPDVAIMGGFIGNTGAYFFYFNGALTNNFAGTSFACPVFAGQLATTEQRVIANGGLPPVNGHQRAGRIQDVFYRENGKAPEWFDVTSGGSTGSLPNGAAAVPHVGWDFTTGWGAINWSTEKLQKFQTLPLSPTFLGAYEGSSLTSSSFVNILDGQFYNIAPATIPNLGQAGSASFSFTMPTTVPRANLQEIDFSATSRFATGSTVQIYLLNFSTGKWDLLKSAPMSATGTSVAAALKTSFTTYVSAAGQYRVLLRGLQPVSAGVTTNSFGTDFLGSKIIYIPVTG